MKILVSAGDAVTARLIKEAGFDGIWVSGFEACCRLGLPDNGTIQLHEMLRICEPIVKATDLPVYVDCDTGYSMVSATATEMKNIGVAGICIEDNPTNKANSLFDADITLVSSDVMKNKVVIAKSIGIEVIARTEALIRCMGYDEAIRRAEIYKEAGADYIMIHTRDETGLEAKTAIQMVKDKGIDMEMVIVPTKFPQMTNTFLKAIGYKMVIWANQTERCKIRAIRGCLEALRYRDSMGYVEKHLSASLEDMRGLMPSG